VSKQRTPAEKKQSSYERDHRNVYGENDKASRKSIPLRKRLRARADRRRASQALAPGRVPSDIEDGDHLDAELLPERDPRQWRKQPDAPLGQIVDKKLKRRAWLRERAAVSPAVTSTCLFPDCGAEATSADRT
jgi:hypothetical protein